MDIFSTIVTGGEILYSFISACAEFSSDAKSLGARFEWDLRILKRFLQFFNDRKAANGGKLSKEDQDLLDSSVAYISTLLDTIAAKRSKIETNGWLKKEWNRVRWVHYKKDLVALEQELFEWTSRFDLRLVALPERLKAVIHLDEPTAKHAPRLATKFRIDQYLASSEQDKRKLGLSMLIKSPMTEVSFLSQTPSRRQIATYKQNTVIVEYKPHATWILQDEEKLKETKQIVSTLASALSFVDPTVTGLLRCAGYFHEEDPNNPRFALVYNTPFSLPNQNPGNLKDLLNAKDAQGNRRTAMHALDKRLTLARRIASAVYFLHVIGWVHKSIRSNNILILEAQSLPSQDAFPHGLGHPYLVNFESARADTATTDLTLSEKEDQWHLNIYRHPERQGSNISARFTMAHDVYSLGVVLLEIGLWRPFERNEKNLGGKSPADLRAELIRMSSDVAIQMGSKYRDLVIWCLQLEDENLGTVDYIKEIMEKLEELVM
jgi:hypothetical protein